MFEELKETMLDYQYQLHGLINLCIELGNKDYENNVLVKDMLAKYVKAKKDLEDYLKKESE